VILFITETEIQARFTHAFTVSHSHLPKGVCLRSLPSSQAPGQGFSSHPSGSQTPWHLWPDVGPRICCNGTEVQGCQLWSPSNIFCVLRRLV